MSTFLLIIAVYFIWMIADFAIIAYAGRKDKLEAILGTKWASLTILLPATLTTIVIIWLIRKFVK